MPQMIIRGNAPRAFMRGLLGIAFGYQIRVQIYINKGRPFFYIKGVPFFTEFFSGNAGFFE